jgi:hypothetical protein
VRSAQAVESEAAMNKSRAKAIGALVGPVGLILGLLGYVGDVYSSRTATVRMLGVWLIGGALVRMALTGKE